MPKGYVNILLAISILSGGVLLRNLTIQRQQLVLDYVNEYIRNHGYPPSVRDICQALDIKSTSTVHNYINRLEDSGKLIKSPSKPRALKILQSGTHGNVIHDEDTAYVPVVGKITAGIPILATENIEYSFPVPSFFVNNAETFMLRVSGDSMINAGIYDRDYILVRQQSDAENGEIIVALIQDEATVKQFFKEKNHIRLQPANERYTPIIVRENMQILGKVIGVFRKL